MGFADIIAIIVLLIFIGVPILLGIVEFVGESLEPKRPKNKYEKLTKELTDKYETLTKELTDKYEKECADLENAYSEKETTLKNTYDRKYMIMEQLITEASQSQPWVAKFIADANYEYDLSRAKILETKERPAFKAADEVRAIGREKRELQILYRTAQAQLEWYESLFPWLEDFREVDIRESYKIVHDTTIGQNEYDTLKNWLSPDEYQKLPNAEKYQLALERYRTRKNKSKWQIGIEYERYIGYLYEQKGYKVQYFGAIEGLNDLGRDLIASNGKKTLIIQCKYWSDTKIIHEKHIFQLFGTLIAYRLKNAPCAPIGIFVTSTVLSDTARLFAKELGIKVVQNKSFDPSYPCIKCNINPSTKEKIYHLPFDQQYDKIVISPERGECYAASVQEAENLGFRRAYRWHKNSNV